MNAPEPAAAAAAETAVDAAALRRALGGFATGVAIVACRDAADVRVGLTINSFAALSLTPPLVLWSLRLESPSLAAFDAARHFSVSVLAESQVELSRRFASPRPAKFDDGQWHAGLRGLPLLDGAVSCFECETLRMHTEGDHRLYIGRVLRVQSQPLPPLVFHGGHYHLLGEVL